MQRQTFYLQPRETNNSEPHKLPKTMHTAHLEREACLPTPSSASLSARASSNLQNHSQASHLKQNPKAKSQKQQLTQPFSFPSLHSLLLPITAPAGEAGLLLLLPWPRPLATPLATPTPQSHDCHPKAVGKALGRTHPSLTERVRGAAAESDRVPPSEA